MIYVAGVFWCLKIFPLGLDLTPISQRNTHCPRSASLTSHCRRWTYCHLLQLPQLLRWSFGSCCKPRKLLSLTSTHPTLALIMAPAQPRPYRRILTSALHRRFVHASALSLLVCYVIAISIGDKSSCKCRAVAPGNLGVFAVSHS